MGNYLLRIAQRYYIYKWLREADKISEKKKADKLRRKNEKKRLIDTYGYLYYLRDKTWNTIKNQKKKETFENWQHRLSLYCFTIDGYDTKYKHQHYSKPFVHEYNFDYKVEERKELEESHMTIWNIIVESFLETPRDVLTYGRRKYFYVYVENDDVYIESGREHKNISNIKVRRKLDSQNFDEVYEKYKSGAKPSEILNITYNSAYWFGIFRELNL